MVQVVSLVTETTAIDTARIPADQFDIPPGWKLQPPAQQKTEQVKCPATAN